MTTTEIIERLEYLRGELRAERISMGELAELQGLAHWIDPSDVELLEPAGVPEHCERCGTSAVGVGFDFLDIGLLQCRACGHAQTGRDSDMPDEPDDEGYAPSDTVLDAYLNDLTVDYGSDDLNRHAAIDHYLEDRLIAAVYALARHRTEPGHADAYAETMLDQLIRRTEIS